MVDIALVFVWLAILVHLLLFGAAVYFIPRVLAEDHGGHEEPEAPSNGNPS